MTAPKDRWLARNWALVWPGLGHVYAGRKGLGIALAVARFALIVIGVRALLAPWGTAPVFSGIFFLMAAVELFAIVDAARGMSDAPPVPAAALDSSSTAEPAAPATWPKRRNPWLALFLSRSIPGLGHAYLGRWGSAIGLFIVCMLSTSLLGPAPVIGAIVAGVCFAWAARQAYLAAGTGGDARAATAIVVLTCLGFLGFATLTGLLRTFVAQAYRMPSESMVPSLLVGDMFLVRKDGDRSVDRGDVVVYDFAPDPSKSFAKRVIGLPGESIEIRAKTVFVNGRPLDEAYVAFMDPTIQPREVSPRDTFGPLRLGPDEYFVMGDNRDNSNDSRFSGPVHRSAIRGRAIKIYWPPDRFGAIP